MSALLLQEVRALRRRIPLAELLAKLKTSEEVDCALAQDKGDKAAAAMYAKNAGVLADAIVLVRRNLKGE